MAEQEELYEEGFEEGYDGQEEIAVEGGPELDMAGQSAEELEAMKKKLKEMEEEAARFTAMQTGTAAVDGAGTSAGAGTAEQASKEEADTRSIYVGNVDYACTPEELQQHFQSCGTVNRVTILTDKFGNPKGFAYVEFLEVDAVSNAILLDNSEIRGRQIKVSQKRTNVPGLKVRGRGRGRGGFSPFAGRGAYGGGGFGGGYGAPFGGRGRGGFAPRGRGRGRFYAPY